MIICGLVVCGMYNIIPSFILITVPLLSFETAKYTINEDSGNLSISIVRTGDISCPVSVICYTRQQSAGVMIDYIERVSCTVILYYYWNRRIIIVIL